jgi:Na+-driven multidrug efflux pump
MGRGGPGGGHLRRDLTEGPIAKTLILFSLPLLGSNALQSLNLTANQFWVSHLLGVTAIAAIGNANVIGFLAQGAIFGATMAANIMIAQSVGAGAMPRPAALSPGRI